MESMMPELVDEPQALVRAVPIDAGVDMHGFWPRLENDRGRERIGSPPPQPHRCAHSPSAVAMSGPSADISSSVSRSSQTRCRCGPREDESRPARSRASRGRTRAAPTASAPPRDRLRMARSCVPGSDRSVLQNPVFVFLGERARRDRAERPRRELRCGSFPSVLHVRQRPRGLRGVLPQVEQLPADAGWDRECCRGDRGSP